MIPSLKYLPFNGVDQKDIDGVVINVLKEDKAGEALVSLSYVNKYTQGILTNDWFKRLFEFQHPLLSEKNLLPSFQSFYSDHSWKIIYSLFSSSQKSEWTTSYPGISLKMPKSVQLRTSSLIREALLSRKEQLITKREELCGNYFGDPRGLLDQAWKNQAVDPAHYYALEGQRKLCDSMILILDINLSIPNEKMMGFFVGYVANEIFDAMRIEESLALAPLLQGCS